MTLTEYVELAPAAPELDPLDPRTLAWNDPARVAYVRAGLAPIFVPLLARGTPLSWLARRTGATLKSVSAYQLGRRWPPRAWVDRACAVMGLPPSAVSLPDQRPPGPRYPRFPRRRQRSSGVRQRSRPSPGPRAASAARGGAVRSVPMT